MTEEIIRQINAFYTEAARHSLAFPDAIAVSVHTDGGAVFRGSYSFEAEALDPRTGSDEAQRHAAVYSSRPDVCCVIRLEDGHAHSFALLGRAVRCSTPLHRTFFPRDIRCVGSVGELSSSVQGENALLLRGVGAYIFSGTLSGALETALALEYVARMRKITEMLRSDN